MMDLAEYRQELELLRAEVLGLSQREVDDMPEGTILDNEPENSVHAQKIALIDQEIEAIEALGEPWELEARKEELRLKLGGFSELE